MKKYSINKARLSLALRTAWKETKTALLLLSIGAKVWRHPESGDLRIYFNSTANDLLEIEKEFYKTGKITGNPRESSRGLNRSNTL